MTVNPNGNARVLSETAVRTDVSEIQSLESVNMRDLRSIERSTVVTSRSRAASAAAEHKRSSSDKERRLKRNGRVERWPDAADLAVTSSNKTTKQKKKSKPALLSEIESLQRLVRDLTTKCPAARSIAMELIERDPTLDDMELLHWPNSVRGGSEVNRRSQQQPSMAAVKTANNLQAVRHEPNRRGQQQPFGTAAPKPLKSRKRDRQNRRTANNAQQNGQSELVEMRKYINQIVRDHHISNVSDANAELPAELRFEGDYSELEDHAQKLVAAGLGRIVEVEIRINRRNNRQAFLSLTTDRCSDERDGMIQLPVARRYAFDGDTVRAFVLNQQRGAPSPPLPIEPKALEITASADDDVDDDDYDADSLPLVCSDESDIEEQEEPEQIAVQVGNCPKAFVIAVVKNTEMREIVGTVSFKLKCQLSDGNTYYKLKPYDMRVPMVFVSEESCKEFIHEHNVSAITDTLFLALILETDVDGYCKAKLIKDVGRVGDLSSEMKAIMYHNNLGDIREYEERFLDMFATPEPPITDEVLAQRRDCRDLCVFSIDPLTARDLDDALSLELIDGVYHVGVHISDVAHYLSEGSELDEIVKERSTSIYLTDKVVHMLPETLCLKCSLLPGEDKFAFSVFFQLDEQANLLQPPRFERTIIHSCAQLAYQHAQKIIDHPDVEFSINDMPEIVNGFEVLDVAQRIIVLNKLARIMRERRFDNGALAINNPKIRFNISAETLEPTKFELDIMGEANHMIEEFMLLANQVVAKFIYKAFPDMAILRNHPPPLRKTLLGLRDKLASLGLELDISSSKSLYRSLKQIINNHKRPELIGACLNQLIMKPMARASYICSDIVGTPDDTWHYALSIPIYTHFTSPIRRYPDIMVHRLLAAALDYSEPPKRSSEELHHLVKVSNERKLWAKCAGDESNSLYFRHYVSKKHQLLASGAIMEMFQHSMNVVLLKTGYVVPIAFKEQKVCIDSSKAPHSILISEPKSKKPPVELRLFSGVDVILVVTRGKLNAYLQSPDKSQRFLNLKNGQSTLINANNSNNNNKNLKQKRH